MPRTHLTPGTINRLTPGTPTVITPDDGNGNSIANTLLRAFLRIRNESGGDLTVTIDVPGTNEGEELPNKVFTIPNNATRYIGPWPSSYNQADDNGNSNCVLVDWSTSTDVFVECMNLPTA